MNTKTVVEEVETAIWDLQLFLQRPNANYDYLIGRAEISLRDAKRKLELEREADELQLTK